MTSSSSPRILSRWLGQARFRHHCVSQRRVRIRLTASVIVTGLVDLKGLRALKKIEWLEALPAPDEDDDDARPDEEDRDPRG